MCDQNKLLSFCATKINYYCSVRLKSIIIVPCYYRLVQNCYRSCDQNCYYRTVRSESVFEYDRIPRFTDINFVYINFNLITKKIMIQVI